MEPFPKNSPSVALPGRWILVVDDEPAIQDVLSLSLTQAGWAVRVVDGAERAVAAIDSAATPPSLLISDVLMPGTDGLELTRRILLRVPGIKVIITSGHLTDISWWPSDLRSHSFLPKPFSREELLSAVHDELGDCGPVE